jgi:hypothetical protein
MQKLQHGLDATEHYNGDERSSRNPDVYIARAKQVAANRKEWERRAKAFADAGYSGNAVYIATTQLGNRPVAYRDGHLVLA